MTSRQIDELRTLEGRLVSLALADRSRIDSARLVAVARGSATDLWLHSAGAEHRLSLADVLEVWEAQG